MIVLKKFMNKITPQLNFGIIWVIIIINKENTGTSIIRRVGERFETFSHSS